MKRFLASLLVLAAILSATGKATEQNHGYYDGSADGWFWYEIVPQWEAPPPPPPPALPSPTTPAPTAPPEPAPLSAKWLREHLPEFRDAAIDNPNDENVRAYKYLERVALDKATRYASASRRAVIADPLLDGNIRRPISSAGARLADQQARKATESVAHELAQAVGIWYFYRSDCPFCHQQTPILKALAEQFGFAVQAISLDGQALPSGAFPDFKIDGGHAALLELSATPAIALVHPASDTVAKIAEGFTALDDLIKRVLMIAAEQGWLSHQRFQDTRPVRNILVSADADSLLSEEVLRDPEKLIAAIRSSLHEQ